MAPSAVNNNIGNRGGADEKDPDHEYFSQAQLLVSSTVLPMALRTAIQLDIFQIIAEAGADAKLSTRDIADRLATSNPDAPMMLDRLLRFLASNEIVTCSVAVGDDDSGPVRLYGVTPLAKYFTKDEDGVSLGAILDVNHHKAFIDSWYQLKDSIVEGGIAFNRVHGMYTYELCGRDLEFNEAFNKAMFHHTTISTKKILESYNGFQHINRLVDVGGGLGVTLNLITRRYPNIQGINFDLPHVVQHAQPYPSVEHVGGDMFQSVPKGDAIFMKWILHNWSDNHCVKLLKNCYDSVPANGKLIVVEATTPVIPQTDVAAKVNAQMDVMMMTRMDGGKGRTQEEFMGLATKAGFSCIKYEVYISNMWVMEFLK